MPSALITGAGSGIGAATANLFAHNGYEVVLLGRRHETLDQVAAAIEASGGSARTIVADVADYRAISEAVAPLALDVVVNNAGIIGPIAPLLETDIGAWHDTMLVNLLGPLHVTRAALPALLASKRGTLINVTSGAAARPIVGWSAYCASKAALSMLTRSISAEYSQEGLRVFELRLGPVETPMREKVRELDPSRRNEDRSRLPNPQKIAKAIAWLAAAGTDRLQDLTVSFEDIVAKMD